MICRIMLDTLVLSARCVTEPSSAYLSLGYQRGHKQASKRFKALAEVHQATCKHAGWIAEGGLAPVNGGTRRVKMLRML